MSGRVAYKPCILPPPLLVPGLVSLPVGSSFPGVESPAGDTPALLRGSKKVVHFATAGDKGMLRLWRSDTGTCVYQQKQVGVWTVGGQVVGSCSCGAHTQAPACWQKQVGGLVVCSWFLRLWRSDTGSCEYQQKQFGEYLALGWVGG